MNKHWELVEQPSQGIKVLRASWSTNAFISLSNHWQLKIHSMDMERKFDDESDNILTKASHGNARLGEAGQAEQQAMILPCDLFSI